MNTEKESTKSGEHCWWCYNCSCVVPPENVTYEELHDPRYGGCGHGVFNREISNLPVDTQRLIKARKALDEINVIVHLELPFVDAAISECLRKIKEICDKTLKD